MYDILSNAGDADAAGCGPWLRAPARSSKSLRQQIFEYVRAAGSTARADLSRALEISPGSATTLTADLIAAGFLREVSQARREQGRGRPPVALEVVSEAFHVIGIKLSDDRHTAVLTDFAGNIIADAALRAPTRRRTLDALLAETADLIDRLLTPSSKTLADVQAVGIGLSGIVDHDTGVVAWSPLLKGRETDLNTAFSDRFGLPVYLDNDANVLTLAELWFGAGRGLADFAVVTIEGGVGMGLVLNNRLYRGSRGMGLELGHTKVQLDGALCRCGRRGCLEAYLADYALTREAATALDLPRDAGQTPQETLDVLYEQAKQGHEAARTIFRRAGRYLSLGLANVVQLFDPELIILSGERMRYDYLYAEEVLTEMRAMSLSEGRAPAKVEIHAWGDLVWARGATALALAALTDAVVGGDGLPT